MACDRDDRLEYQVLVEQALKLGQKRVPSSCFILSHFLPSYSVLFFMLKYHPRKCYIDIHGVVLCCCFYDCLYLNLTSFKICSLELLYRLDFLCSKCKQTTLIINLCTILPYYRLNCIQNVRNSILLQHISYSYCSLINGALLIVG